MITFPQHPWDVFSTPESLCFLLGLPERTEPVTTPVQIFGLGRVRATLAQFIRIPPLPTAR